MTLPGGLVVAPQDPADNLAAPFVPWEVFLPWFVGNVGQGEHVSAVGQTRSGKTTLLELLAKARTDASAHWHTVVLANKPKDAQLDSWARSPGWRRVSSWERIKRGDRRVLLWPRLQTDADFLTQAVTFDHALREGFRNGGHTFIADEIRYLTKTLGLRSLVELWYLQGGSMGAGLWAGTQRAAWVPLEFYSQARWLLLFRESSPAARKALTDHCGGADGRQVARIVSRLGRREFLCVDTWEGTLVRSRAVLPGKPAR